MPKQVERSSDEVPSFITTRERASDRGRPFLLPAHPCLFKVLYTIYKQFVVNSAEIMYLISMASSSN